ncbi:MAG: hypothetical protein KatS3mg091_202 [Patescibacteria group bacterium]|nr:MAG: hypothetical protein KatS3mg091_202 [Patescibacteria group bacterium]
MKTFLTACKLTVSEYLSYRTNFILWRLRNFLYLFLYYNFWSAVYTYQKQIGNYNKQEIFFYFIVSFFLSDLVFSSKVFKLAAYINSGLLSKYLIYPVSVFKLVVAEELVDKAFNVIFSIVEVMLFVYLFKIQIFIEFSFYYLIIFLLALISGILLYFFINLSISLLGFWTNSVWAPRFISFIVIQGFSGAFFPLDILPDFLYRVVNALPFSVLIYLPMQIIQNKINFDLAVTKVAIAFVWVFLFYALSSFMWKKGLKNYSAYGL